MNDFLRRHIEDIVSLTDDEFAFVSSFFTVKKLRKHQFLVQQGEPVNTVYLTVKGCLKSYYLDEDGKEHIFQFAVEDWWISDCEAFYLRTNATISVDCIEDSELLALMYDDREKICAAVHKMEHFFRVKSNLGRAALQQRILSLLNKNAFERYEQFATLYPQILRRVPKRLIASYLGVSRETLSRFALK